MDQEITAMATVAEALDNLDEEARKRVLQWAAAKFSVVIATGTTTHKQNNASKDVSEDASESSDDTEFETFAELYAAARPSTLADKVLVAGYWSQIIKQEKELTSAPLNKDLSDLGHKITNISNKFDVLIKQKPQLALQLKKSGSTKQARKKYKLTQAGIGKVKSMLGSSND
jgi:hypothetical protein